MVRVGVFFLMCGLALLDSHVAHASQATRVIVLVRAEGKPLPKIDVTVGDKRGATDANGEFTIDVPAGAYHVTVSSAAHLPFTT